MYVDDQAAALLPRWKVVFFFFFRLSGERKSCLRLGKCMYAVDHNPDNCFTYPEKVRGIVKMLFCFHTCMRLFVSSRCSSR